MTQSLSVKNAVKYSCNLCDFGCSKLSNYKAHLSTLKHQTNDGTIMPPRGHARNSARHHKCVCGKAYVYRQGLYNHRKKCHIKEIESDDEDDDDSTSQPTGMSFMFSQLMQQNNELQKQLMEMCKINNTVINNTSHTNSHNKTFNLQVFLNEDCKDAMNLTEFVNLNARSNASLKKTAICF